MRKMLAATLLCLTSFGCSSQPRPAPSEVPKGLLGPPIGTFLRLEGIREEHGKVGTRSLLVQKVGDTVLQAPVGIWVENLELPVGARCAISGYETGRWIGLPPEVERAEGLSPHQAGWQFQHYFIATSVQAPPDLAKSFRAGEPSK